MTPTYTNFLPSLTPTTVLQVMDCYSPRTEQSFQRKQRLKLINSASKEPTCSESTLSTMYITQFNMQDFTRPLSTCRSIYIGPKCILRLKSTMIHVLSVNVPNSAPKNQQDMHIHFQHLSYHLYQSLQIFSHSMSNEIMKTTLQYFVVDTPS